MKKLFFFASGVVGMVGVFLVLGSTIGSIPTSIGFAIESAATKETKITSPMVATQGIAFVGGWGLILGALTASCLVENDSGDED